MADAGRRVVKGGWTYRYGLPEEPPKKPRRRRRTRKNMSLKQRAVVLPERDRKRWKPMITATRQGPLPKSVWERQQLAAWVRQYGSVLFDPSVEVEGNRRAS